LGPLERAKGPNRVGVSLPSPEDGSTSSFRNVVAFYLIRIPDDAQCPEPIHSYTTVRTLQIQQTVKLAFREFSLVHLRRSFCPCSVPLISVPRLNASCILTHCSVRKLKRKDKPKVPIWIPVSQFLSCCATVSIPRRVHFH
jgi:hypothetical protein